MSNQPKNRYNGNDTYSVATTNKQTNCKKEKVTTKIGTKWDIRPFSNWKLIKAYVSGSFKLCFLLDRKQFIDQHKIRKNKQKFE